MAADDVIGVESRDTKSSDEENEDYFPIAPDGGWGWMVVLAVFGGNLLIDGCAGSFGILYPELRDGFQSSPSLTSLAGSLIVAVFLFSRIGLGLNSLSGHVMVNSYFNKRRGIAGGIVSSGAGFGVFILAPLLQFLVYSYAWRGAVLIFSGVMLHFSVFASLMRPLEDNRRPSSPCSTATESDEEIVDSNTSDCDKTHAQVLIKGSKEDKTDLRKQLFANGHSYIENKSLLKHSDKRVNGYLSSYDIHTPELSPEEIKNLNSLPDLSKIDSKRAISQQNHRNADRRRRFINHHHHDHHHHGVHHLNPFLRKDVFFTSSLHHLKEYQKADSISSFVNSMIIHDQKSIDDHSGNKNGNTIILQNSMPEQANPFDLSIFRNSVYIPMLLGAVFIQMGQFIPSTFIPEYARESAVNIFGRLSAGILVNMRCLSALWICNVAMFLCAVCCALFPFCTSFATLCAFSVCFGFFIGYFPPLQILIMVEYLGLDKLTPSVGFLQMAKGPAALVGPPMAGLVYEWTQNYAMSMEFAALLFLLAALVQSLVPLIDRCSAKRQDSGSMFSQVDCELECERTYTHQ
ncbi:MOT9-like protein [Mya arenaria]|uniref:MOT9-like protein n=1 Tax=Mya arenaria TaxID=6604 RepID=A0ABY7FAR8_MYAAR|nr:MOT9-like protein [Mya arenaria]